MADSTNHGFVRFIGPAAEQLLEISTKKFKELYDNKNDSKKKEYNGLMNSVNYKVTQLSIILIKQYLGRND